MTKPRIAAIVAAATLGAAAFTGAAVALAADNTPSPSASASAPSRDGQGTQQRGPGERGGREHGDHGPGGHGPGGHGPGARGPEGHMLHSEGVVEQADGTYITVRMQEGEVTAVSATSLTVKSADGYTSTYVINSDTELERDRAEDAPKVGDTVHVRATVTGSTATADDVHALSPEQAKAMEEHRAEMEDGVSERTEGSGRA
ncbi:MAG: hypothetical protein RL134_2147 [Actinomycetota bacterium]|jgi:Spy/CpxP family protein refolding chaperone